MENFDDIFSKYRNEFDAEEPPENHFLRFQQKLKKQNSSSKQLIIRYLVRFSAAAAVFVFAFLLFQNTSGKPEILVSKLSLKDISPEYMEVESFLESKFTAKYNQFVKLECKETIFSKDKVINDLKEIDKTYSNLQKELWKQPDNERVINAMIDCYRSKEMILTRVITHIEKNCS